MTISFSTPTAARRAFPLPRPCPASFASSGRVWLIATPIFSLAPICGPHLPSSASSFRILKALVTALGNPLPCPLDSSSASPLLHSHPPPWSTRLPQLPRKRRSERGYPRPALRQHEPVPVRRGQAYTGLFGRVSQEKWEVRDYFVSWPSWGLVCMDLFAW